MGFIHISKRQSLFCGWGLKEHHYSPHIRCLYKICMHVCTQFPCIPVFFPEWRPGWHWSYTSYIKPSPGSAPKWFYRLGMDNIPPPWRMKWSSCSTTTKTIHKSLGWRVVYPTPIVLRWNLVRTPCLRTSLFYGPGLKSTESTKSLSIDVNGLWIRPYIIILNVNGQGFDVTSYPQRQVPLSCLSSQHCDWELF